MPAKSTNKTITLISTIVVISFMTIVGVIGYIGNKSFAPKLIDDLFGISRFVFTEISKRVDSGYTGTFVFANSSINKNPKLIFFAEKDQFVKISLIGNSLGENVSKIRVLIDNSPWLEDKELPYTLIHGDITDKLRFDEPGSGLHFIRIIQTLLIRQRSFVLVCRAKAQFLFFCSMT